MRNLYLLVAALSALILSSIGSTQASQFTEGKEYEIIAPKGSEKPVVHEYFNYACGACFRMEAFAEKFKKDNPDVEFKAVPVELNASWQIYVKAYFLAEKLGLLEKSHTALFNRIHVDKKYFKNDADMKTFFLELGAVEKDYDETVNSYWMSTQLRLAKQQAMKSKVIATPTFIVNERYKILNSKLDSMDDLEKIIVEFAKAPQ